MSKILAIDDDITTLQLLEFLLTKHNYEVTVATSGAEGIEKAKVVIPDLILLDVMMPQMDGIDACKNLRASDKTAKIPILFLSALGQDIEVMRGLMAGSDGYIVKPFEPDNLLEQIGKLIKNKTGG